MNASFVVEEFGERMLTITLDIDFTCSPFDPGNTYGPPENCYPPEGGEIEDMTLTVDSATQDEPLRKLSDAELDAVQTEFDAWIDSPAGQVTKERIDEHCMEVAAERASEPDYDE